MTHENTRAYTNDIMRVDTIYFGSHNHVVYVSQLTHCFNCNLETLSLVFDIFSSNTLTLWRYRKNPKTTALNGSTYIITKIATRPFGLAAILVIMYVSIFKIVGILYAYISHFIVKDTSIVMNSGLHLADIVLVRNTIHKNQVHLSNNIWIKRPLRYY
jgi:hypothetical protein